MNGVVPLRQTVVDHASDILHTLRQTKYVHDPFIDPDAGIYDVDCSAFVTYILECVAPDHLRMIQRKPVTEKRLLAHDYYAFFSSLPTETTNGWRRILYLPDARPGDLVAWALPLTGHGDTGHCFVVAEVATPIDDSTMAVKAYDASDIRHYDDSRGSDQTGVGSGTFHLQVDDRKAVAFQFGPRDPIITEGIAIARIE